MFVPDSVEAIRSAAKQQGPLTFCERIDSEDFPVPPMWTRVLADIQGHMFALARPAIGHHLFRIECTGDAVFV